MTQKTPQRTAAVLGAWRPFGAEIVARLELDGFAVTAIDESADEASIAAGGPLDAFVVNAPVQLETARFVDIAEADFVRALQTQLYDVVSAGQAAVRRLRRGGAIAHVTSHAHLGTWGGAHQSAAGAALVAMSRSMALELDSNEIRVNTLATDFVGSAWDTPAARESVAAAVSFLVNSDSESVSGETILLDRAGSLRMRQSARRADL
jgi:NAD(P)-dependent dehydrogenase (short-subunit alcohol dehydrogenase family)